MAENPLYVSSEEYAAEEELLYTLDTRITALEDQWERYVAAYPDRLVVSRTEYEMELAEVSRLERSLEDEWTRWGHYMATRRRSLGVAARQEERAGRVILSALERFYSRRIVAFYRRSAATYLGLIRRTRSSITSLQEAVRRERSRLTDKFIMSPEMEKIVSELQQLESQRERERERFQRKIIRLEKILSRIKIRLYNLIEGKKGSPVGMFQGWFDIDTVIDPVTGEPDWSWWLTKEEVAIAKYHFVGFWKGAQRWLTPEDVGQAYFDEKGGIAYSDSQVRYKTKTTGELYTKNVPEEFIRRARMMTIEDLIVGESSVEAQTIEEIQGVYFEQVMIVEDGVVKWHERREKWAWKPPRDYIERVKEELGLGSL